jgi:hypothetical protein
LNVGNLWRWSPGALKVAIVAALLGFVVNIESLSVRRTNGVMTSCSYSNSGRTLFGAITVVAIFGAFSARRQQRVDERFPINVMVVLALVLAAVAAYLVVTGLGFVGGPCN